MTRPLRVVSLFSGIGGFELGLASAGFEPILFCDNDPAAQAVLRAAWPAVPIADDVQSLNSLPDCEVITAGFPCQDLSQAGTKAGIEGSRSGLVGHLFRLLGTLRHEPEWVVLENVPYMLGLNRGAAMERVISEFERLGFAWAYRVVDCRAFGIPQRRQRVVFLASRRHSPEATIGEEDARPLIDEKPAVLRPKSAYGFYWTEGCRGLGWVRDAVPPIKGGSGLGIPSPPAIWVPKTGELGKPTIRDAERLQGFPAGWTESALPHGRGREGVRWRLVGNAVNVATAKWIGQRLVAKPKAVPRRASLCTKTRWPTAAAGRGSERVQLQVGTWPMHLPMQAVTSFLLEPLTPLSHRAASGFLSRALSTPKLVYAPDFLDFLHSYCARTATSPKSAKLAG